MRVALFILAGAVLATVGSLFTAAFIRAGNRIQSEADRGDHLGIGGGADFNHNGAVQHD